MCGGPRPPRGVEGTSGLDTQWSCRCLVPAESRGAFSMTGQAASVCSPPDQYHCKRVLGPGSEMPPCARPSRAALASSPACPYLHALPHPGEPQPVRIPPHRSSRGLPASAAATPRCQEALSPPGCPSCPALSPHLGASFASRHFLDRRTEPWGRGPGSVCTQVGNRSRRDPPQAALSRKPA